VWPGTGSLSESPQMDFLLFCDAQAQYALLKEWGEQLDKEFGDLTLGNQKSGRKNAERRSHANQGAPRGTVNKRFSLGGRSEGPDPYFVPSHGYKAVRTDGRLLLRFMEKRPKFLFLKEMQALATTGEAAVKVQVRSNVSSSLQILNLC
jgi:hypothetical protein